MKPDPRKIEAYCIANDLISMANDFRRDKKYTNENTCRDAAEIIMKEFVNRNPEPGEQS